MGDVRGSEGRLRAVDGQNEELRPHGQDLELEDVTVQVHQMPAIPPAATAPLQAELRFASHPRFGLTLGLAVRQEIRTCDVRASQARSDGKVWGQAGGSSK